MNLCLVRPPTITTAGATCEDAAAPLGLAYLAAVARDAGHRVTIVDALGEALDRYTRIAALPTGLRHGLHDDEIVARIPGDTEVIGVSTMFSVEWPMARDLALAIRAAFPRALIVAGGEHVTALPEYSLADCPALDACVLGEGESVLVDLLEAAGRGLPLAGVSGLCVRTPDGTLSTGPRPRLRELQGLPRPAWDLTAIDAYLDQGVMMGVDFGRSIPMLASRGCPFQCTFCSNPGMWGTLWRARPPADVLDEMCDYLRRYRVSNFDFHDLTAIVDRDWILEFCRLIVERGVAFTWQLPSGTRSEAIDAEVTAMLFRAGCRFVTYAPESGSEETLARIKKRISTTRMLASMRAAVASGLGVKANIIFGFPDETLGHAAETYRFIVQMARAGIDDVAVVQFSPYPGSALFDALRASGRLVLDDEYFYGLAHYSDSRYCESYSAHMSRTTLRLLCLGAMALFYTVSFARRPWRVGRLVANVVRQTPRTRLASALLRVIGKQRELRRVPRAPAAALPRRPAAVPSRVSGNGRA